MKNHEDITSIKSTLRGYFWRNMGGYDFANVRAHAWRALWSAGKVLCLHLGGDYKGVWLVNPNTVDLIVVLCHGYGK